MDAHLRQERQGWNNHESASDAEEPGQETRPHAGDAQRRAARSREPQALVGVQAADGSATIAPRYEIGTNDGRSFWVAAGLSPHEQGDQHHEDCEPGDGYACRHVLAPALMGAAKMPPAANTKPVRRGFIVPQFSVRGKREGDASHFCEERPTYHFRGMRRGSHTDGSVLDHWSVAANLAPRTAADFSVEKP